MRSRYGSVGQQVANLSGHTGWILCLSCRGDGRVFASSSTDGYVFMGIYDNSVYKLAILAKRGLMVCPFQDCAAVGFGQAILTVS